MFAIVEAGGRQAKVAPGTVVVVDRVTAEPGAEITFDKVLLVEQGDGQIVAGTPYVAGPRSPARSWPRPRARRSACSR